MSKWSFEFILACGRIDVVQYWCNMCRVGLCSAEHTKDGYIFYVNVNNAGVESHERNHFEWYNKQTEIELRKFQRLNRREGQIINKEMNRLVAVANRYYMTYDTNPEIDNYYSRLGKIITSTMTGVDAFPPHVCFGGIEFSQYCKAVQEMTSWTLKHLDFAHLLLKKRSYLNPRHLYTLINYKEQVIDYLHAATEIERDNCATIIDLMTLSIENYKQHSEGASVYIMPSFVLLDNSRLIAPIWGNLSEPYMFLLASLKDRFEKEWFDNVNARESYFRYEMYSLFSEVYFVKVDRSILIRKNGKSVTDIDAVIYDKRTNDLALFQLKFQDLFGKSLQQRSNRKQDMLKANRWVTSIIDWVNRSSEREIADILGLRGESINKNQVHLFVMGRYAAHFSGSELPDSRAAWCIWVQFKRILCENHNISLAGIFHSIVEESPYKNQLEGLNDEIITIGATKFIISCIN